MGYLRCLCHQAEFTNSKFLDTIISLSRAYDVTDLRLLKGWAHPDQASSLVTYFYCPLFALLFEH